jgi:serine/threonine protein kinase/ABC-type phosphate/phosphonate transport system substrate-binding protein
LHPVTTLMSEPRPCRECGALIPRDAPSGHCPGCLLRRAFAALSENAEISPAGSGRFGEYELIERIGRGGMGVVYKARQISLKRMVALKMLGPNASAFPGIAQRLRLEAETAGSLRHPHIVTIFDVGEYEGQPFFAMELIEGHNLETFIGPDGFRDDIRPQGHGERDDTPAAIARVMVQVARAVDHAHKHGVLHRDLKPANVIIDNHGEPHLTDFGLAKVLGRSATTSTASGAVLGTPAYMAPEQASGDSKRASTAADIYSLGAILYTMLTGQPPFGGDTPLETLRKVAEENPKPPTTFDHAVNRDLATVSLKCLEKEPEHRYSSAAALVSDLERWLRGEPIEARPVRRMERAWRWCRREPVLASLIGGVFVLLTALAILALVLFKRERTHGISRERQLNEQRTVLLNRIEEDWRTKPFVPISSYELAAILGRKWEAGAEAPIVLGLQANLQQPDQFLSNWGPLVSYFYTKSSMVGGLRLVVGIRIYTSLSNAIDGLLRGEVDVMRADPALYALAGQEAAPFVPLIREVYGTDDSGTGTAIFVRANSGIKSLEQLRGKTFAFGESGSALNDLLPKALLVAGGLHTGDFLRFTNLHSDRVLAAVGGGYWDAGVTSLAYLSPGTGPGSAFEVIAKVQSPSFPWLFRNGLDMSTLAAIRQALLSLHDNNVLGRIDSRLTGFQATVPSDYDVLAQSIAKAKEFDRH